MKALLFGLVIASPAVAVWKLRGGPRAEIRQTSNSARTGATVRIPVEVIAKGSAPEWVYIDVASQALPKPRSAHGSR